MAVSKDKLTDRQAALLQAMRDGVKVRFMGYMGRFNPNAYFYREDTHERVTTAATGLQRRGLAKLVGGYNDRTLALTEQATEVTK
jgi:hypothetical protein